MSLAVRIVDQVPGVHPHPFRHLHLASERTSLRQLLEKRIAEEVAAFNAGGDEAVRLLVTPTEREQALNDRPAESRQLDAVRQLAAAIEAFERTRILVIVNEKQVLDLDQPLIVTPDTEIRFVKLVPLVGG